MNQLSIDFAARARDVGIARATDHAERIVPGWPALAYQFLQTFVRNQRKPFLGEDVIAAAEAYGLIAPPDRRAWGGIFQRASRSGLVVKIGYGPAKTRRLSSKPLWERG